MLTEKNRKQKSQKKVVYFTFLTGDGGAPWPPATEGAVAATDADCILAEFALLVTAAKVLVLSAKYLQDFNFHLSFTISSFLHHRVDFLLKKRKLSEQHFIIYSSVFCPLTVTWLVS